MDISEELERLRALHERGALNDTEYAAAKARVLGTAGDAGFGPGGPAGGSAAGPSGGQQAQGALHRLFRSRTDRWLGGVCGGLGRLMGVPGWVLRLLFVLSACLMGTGVLLYILLWIFIPEDPVGA
jgi:phage shock protein PspC (stress-responsive transcriptional regulator)